MDLSFTESHNFKVMIALARMLLHVDWPKDFNFIGIICPHVTKPVYSNAVVMLRTTIPKITKHIKECVADRESSYIALRDIVRITEVDAMCWILSSAGYIPPEGEDNKGEAVIPPHENEDITRLFVAAKDALSEAAELYGKLLRGYPEYDTYRNSVYEYPGCDVYRNSPPGYPERRAQFRLLGYKPWWLDPENLGE